MTTKANLGGRKRALDAALKADFDAKAAEPAPQRLADLARELDLPPASKRTTTG